MVSHAVDSYLDLRRLLTRQLGYVQQDCCAAAVSTTGRCCWIRATLRLLEDTSRTSWRDAGVDRRAGRMARGGRPRDSANASCCVLRSRDVLEHVGAMLSHVRRLNAETAVQMPSRPWATTIMRTLTVLTAIFLPLNLITGFLRHELRLAAFHPLQHQLSHVAIEFHAGRGVFLITTSGASATSARRKWSRRKLGRFTADLLLARRAGSWQLA
jgi:hypothetical protein